jgi:hypothetical protein
MIVIGTTFFKAKIEGLERQINWVQDSCDRAEADAVDLRDDLSKAEALRAEEVARAANLIKALAKSEALCVEMVVTLFEKDQTIADLQVELAGNKGSLKEAISQGGISRMTPSKKKQEDLIVELWAKLWSERMTI